MQTIKEHILFLFPFLKKEASSRRITNFIIPKKTTIKEDHYERKLLVKILNLQA